VIKSEGRAVSFIHARVAEGTVVDAGEASTRDGLNAKFEAKRIHHEEL
jgi:hypothetical protein